MLSIFEKMIELTSWQVDKPPSYGIFHIIVLILAFSITLSLAFLLRKTNEKTNKWLIFGCGLFLLISEIYKNIFYYEVEMKFTHTYRWGIISFQLCSIPMYLCLAIPFLKEGKIKQAFYDFLVSYNFVGGFMALFEPSGVFNKYVMIMGHSIIWHTMLVFLGFYLIASGRAAKRLKDFKYTVILYYILAVIAVIINSSLYKKSNGSCNMFFLGYKGPNVIVYNDIYAKLGWFPNVIIFTVTLSLGAFIIFFISNLIQKAKSKKKQYN